eukprot:9747389-Ditylum_brightwellii.AAC.1
MKVVSADSSNSGIRPDLDQQRNHSTTITTVVTTQDNNDALDIFCRQCTKNVQTDRPKPCDTRTPEQWLRMVEIEKGNKDLFLTTFPTLTSQTTQQHQLLAQSAMPSTFSMIIPQQNTATYDYQ